MLLKKNTYFSLREKHNFHLVDSSQLPVVTAFSTMAVVLSLVFYGHPTKISFVAQVDSLLLHIALLGFTLVLFSGFFSVVRESKAGHHTEQVRTGLRYGMALFIVSEVLFFFAFFGGFFHFSLAPAMSIGCVGPPKSIQPLDVGGLPLVNTLLLLSSGITITLAHHAILKADSFSEYTKFAKYLFLTILLGVTFLICQGIEYKYGVTFHGNENVFGSSFFVTTGFHGFHVTVGTIFLLFCLVRTLMTIAPIHSDIIERLQYFLKYHYILYDDDFDEIRDFLAKFAFTKKAHFGFEAAAGYGHFVDVVGLFLFITVYGGGS